MDRSLPIAGAAGAARFEDRYPAFADRAVFSPRQRAAMGAYYDHIVAFSERYVGPQALAIEQRVAAEPQWLPQELLSAACRAGLFSAPFPTWLGGGGVPFPALYASYEVLAGHCLGVANLLGVSGLAIACVMASFDPRALRRVAQLVCAGERRGEPVFLSTCVTEPGAGSDAEDADEFATARIQTFARPVAGGLRLSGTKIFISNGSLASLHVVAAFTDRRHRPEDLVLLLVPASSPGVGIARNEHKLGQRVCPASVVEFDDVFVADDMICRSGPAGRYAEFALANVLGMTRAGVGAFAAGAAEGAYRAAAAAAQRLTWRGEPMDAQQWVRMELAHMARRAQLARSAWVDALMAVRRRGLLRHVDAVVAPPLPRALLRSPFVQRGLARILDAPASARASQWLAQRQAAHDRDVACAFGDCAKVSGSDLAVENCQRALSLVGKEALRHDAGIEKRLRDARLLQIYEGTNQVNMVDFYKRRVARQVAHA